MNSSGASLFIIVVAYLAFISLGLPDGLLGIAWPFMSTKFKVPLDALGILLIGFTFGYLLTSTASGIILKIISLGMLLTLSCILTGISLLTYALSDTWYFAIAASFFLGSGGGAIDSSINTFAASRFSPATVNWLHAFYGVGATAGPLIVTFMLARKFEWYHGYMVVAGIQISLSVLFLLTQGQWKISTDKEEHHSGAEYLQTLKQPVVWVNIVIFFLYTGLEQGFGQWIFTILTKSRGIGEEEAGLWTSAYWGSLTAGRILSGLVLTRIPVNKALICALWGIVAGTLLVAADIGSVFTLMGIMILGFSNAPVFPSLISITPERVGKEHVATAIGVQISFAMIGASLLPGIAGSLINVYGVEIIPGFFSVAAILLIVVYVFTTVRSAKSI